MGLFLLGLCIGLLFGIISQLSFIRTVKQYRQTVENYRITVTDYIAASKKSREVLLEKIKQLTKEN